jgi:hypothetical protein
MAHFLRFQVSRPAHFKRLGDGGRICGSEYYILFSAWGLCLEIIEKSDLTGQEYVYILAFIEARVADFVSKSVFWPKIRAEDLTS